MVNGLQLIRIPCVALALGVVACTSSSPLPGDLHAVEGYVRHRDVLDAEVVRRTAYFAPQARDWSLLVTEHRGATEVRDVLEARDRYARRWHYLEVGPADGLDLAGRRAMAWNVAHPRPGAAPLRTVHAVLPWRERTLVLEYRGPAEAGFDELRRRLADYRPRR